MQPGKVDFEQRTGLTFAFFWKFRFDDGTLRSFTGSTIVFHGQSGDTTFHYTSPSANVALTTVEATANAGIRTTIPYTTTDDWLDEQVFFYQLVEWVSGERFTLAEGNIIAVRGVVDGAD